MEPALGVGRSERSLMLNLAWKTLPRLQSPRIDLLLESGTGENDLSEEDFPEEE